MLIDTKQIVNLTNLRLFLGKRLEEVDRGKIFLISKKGKIQAALVPVSYLGEERSDIFERIADLRKRIGVDLKDKKNVWRSEKLLKKIRAERISRLKRF